MFSPRARSAYIFFTIEKRQEIVQQNPDMKAKDILKELARLWKELPDEEKAKYQKMSDEDKRRIDEEKERATSKPSESNHQSKPLFKFGPNRPRSPENQKDSENSDDDQKPIQKPITPRAKSAYIFFTSEKRPEIVQQNPDMTMKDILKELARLWNELPDEERAKYQKMSDEDKRRIDEEKERATSKPSESNHQSKPLFKFGPNRPRSPENQKDSENSDDDQKPIQKPIQKSITPRAKSAYILFTIEKRQEIVQQNPDMKQKDILKELARLWKELPDEERAKYQKMSDEEKARLLDEKSPPKIVSKQIEPKQKFLPSNVQQHQSSDQENKENEKSDASIIKLKEKVKKPSNKLKKIVRVKKLPKQDQIAPQFNGDLVNQVSFIVNEVMGKKTEQSEINKLCQLIQPIIIEQVKSKVNLTNSNFGFNNFVCPGNNCGMQFGQPQFGFASCQPFMNPYGGYFGQHQMQLNQQPQFGFY